MASNKHNAGSIWELFCFTDIQWYLENLLKMITAEESFFGYLFRRSDQSIVFIAEVKKDKFVKVSDSRWLRKKLHM